MLMTEIFCTTYSPKMSHIAEFEENKRISEWVPLVPRIASNHPTHDENNQTHNVFESMTYDLPQRQSTMFEMSY